MGVKESQRQWKWNSNFQSASRVCDLAAASGSPAVLCQRSEAAKQGSSEAGGRFDLLRNVQQF